MKDKKREMFGLCYRCEHRAQYLHDVLNAPRNEKGEKEFVHSPRCECGSNSSVHSCYMYRPVKPYILKNNDGDKRDVLLPQFMCGRAHAVCVAQGEYNAIRNKDKTTIFFFELKKDAETKKLSNKRKSSGLSRKSKGKLL